MEYPARTSKGSELDNAAGRGQEAHAGRAASLLQARIACVSHRPQLVQRIDRRVVECLVFWIVRGFLVREPDFTDRLFDLSGSVSCFQRLNRKVGDGNAVILPELVLDKHTSKLLQNALLPTRCSSRGIRAPQKTGIWNFGSRYRGKGGEGKSRIGLVLKKLMGDAVSNGSIQKIETSRFARADLEHRLLMVDDDMDMNALPKTNYLKSIVTAEAKMDVERKGIQSYQSDLYARFLGFGNGALTSLYDHSDGFWRRQLILTTKERPTDREDDPFLVEKLCEELEGILLWCLEGLTRLLRNNYKFTVSARAAGNLDTVKRSSNNVLDFLESEGYFRFKADAEVSSKCLYEVYKVWCDDNACRPVSPNRLSTELNQQSLRYNLEATNNIYLPGGRRVRGFVGIEALIHPCQQ